jgi:hypothetical protein
MSSLHNVEREQTVNDQLARTGKEAVVCLNTFIVRLEGLRKSMTNQ